MWQQEFIWFGEECVRPVKSRDELIDRQQCDGSLRQTYPVHNSLWDGDYFLDTGDDLSPQGVQSRARDGP